ncbi:MULTISPECIES: DNA-3-methyladenine glycosylase family protein [Burkholderia]|uniref:DNA-3-methyladenine glycosylase II n=1 Tax=Burkholderia vietnamiensis TaxID=60552 RepID=A0ABS1AX70_BURVI|nr:DNA-3-methyladenine glycosylase [Burkholderia vietnamiensis]AJY07238.1 hhH-GPD superbase excision DNA repair family protein [Burkholderia vietnamiensis LMG 10929]AOK00651.1 DNA-3-methyladenine glycosylase [Burkholderia vietnamiensis]AOK41323.1 DNA-3-methyladenine glycosylase [Burkholderia vietnamiensis]AVR17010.1 DNA-3-methyladenine glycosylase 2 family protein [Burkholderia vietnamiensis]KVE03436.1 DNA-3-methyladenine glycosylase [Burkholderia vietnamiensis]
MATARKAPVRRATPLAARPAAKRGSAAKSDATRAVLNGALNGHAKPVRAKGVDPAQPETTSAAADTARKVRASDDAGSADVVRPAYWDKACADLVKRDRILKKLIPKFGPAHLVKRGEPFVTLARSVVGQQISVPSAQALWARIEDACPKLAPQPVIRLGADKLIACGLSKRKTEYILDLAQHFVSGALHVDKWTSMDDEDVIAELTQIRGISRWTAEMFLIFNLSRPDVLPLDDPGLIRAISVNYFSGEPVTRSEAREVAANWEPWRTVATWYMWRSLDVPDGDVD